ncbi:hypothetical protein ACLOAV_009958 [Pseudogymnoascus australis]
MACLELALSPRLYTENIPGFTTNKNYDCTSPGPTDGPAILHLTCNYNLICVGKPQCSVFHLRENSKFAAAYVHRDKLLLYQFSDIETHGQYPEDGFAVLQQFRDSVTDSLDDGKWGMYVNYVDTQLDVNTAQTLYWGRNLLRLQSIKTKLDPNQVFWDPHSIRPLF